MTSHPVGVWMKLYVGSWLAASRKMPLAARGAYVDLLALAWEEGSIPADSRELACFLGISLTEFEEVWRTLRSKWVQHPDNPARLVNERQESVRSEQEERVKERAEWRERQQRRRDKQRDTKRDVTRDNMRDIGLGSGIRDQDVDPSLRDVSTSATARRAKARLDGKAELRAALEAIEAETAMPVRSDLIEAAERYRERRVKRRGSVWDRDQWLGLFRPHAGDPLALIEALGQATQAGWLSVHVRGERRRLSAAEERQERAREIDRKFLARFEAEMDPNGIRDGM